MKTVFLTAAVVAALLWVAQPATAQIEFDSSQQQTSMAKAMELAQPGEEHKLMEKLTGEWNVEAKMWMAPGAEPLVVPGKASAKMVLGGRFLHGEYTSDGGSMQTEGLFIMGFDRRHEEFTYVGFDTWGTYSVYAEGTRDEETGKITLYGEDEDPVMGHTQKYDFVITFVSEDSWRFEVIFYDEAHTHGADSFKMVDVLYSRAE